MSIKSCNWSLVFSFFAPAALCVLAGCGGTYVDVPGNAGTAGASGRPTVTAGAKGQAEAPCGFAGHGADDPGGPGVGLPIDEDGGSPDEGAIPDEGDAFNCSAFVACGGDLTGAWKIQTSCYNEAASQELAGSMGTDPGGGEASCFFLDEGCSCTFERNFEGKGRHAYSLHGNTFTETDPSDDTATVSEYCVDGNTLSLRRENGEILLLKR